MQALMQRYPFIGDVRGTGLLLAFELVADRRPWRRCPRDLAPMTG
jgi:4-aminobutyrate aminotransferase-like enzyme